MLLLNQITFLLARNSLEGVDEPTERGYAISWALILLSVILGLVVALRTPKREDSVKKPKKD